jgi:phosphatidylglycerol:prolipoprotein diacylglycerol transferase
MQPTYSLIMMAAMAAGIAVSRYTQRASPLSRGQRWIVSLGAICGGIVGAKLPFVLMDWDGFLSGMAWLENGKTITFGLVGGYFGVEAAKWAAGVRTKTGDSFAVPVAVSIGLGRFACFSAGCCFGQPTSLPWGVDFGDGVLRHPTQIYEVLFHLSAAVMLFVMQRRGIFHGQLIKLYFIAYFAYRFLTEFIRPEPRMSLDLTGYQWAALAFIPIFVVLWIHDARMARREEETAIAFGERVA